MVMCGGYEETNELQKKQSQPEQERKTIGKVDRRSTVKASLDANIEDLRGRLLLRK